MIDLTESPLFENLLETKDEFLHLDLHNDYTCVDILLEDGNLFLKFRNDREEGFVRLRFTEVTLIKIHITLQSLTIDNLHRGRYELNGELHDEYFEKKCFYIEFYEGGSLDLLCKKAAIEISNSKHN